MKIIPFLDIQRDIEDLELVINLVIVITAQNVINLFLKCLCIHKQFAVIDHFSLIMQINTYDNHEWCYSATARVLACRYSTHQHSQQERTLITGLSMSLSLDASPSIPANEYTPSFTNDVRGSCPGPAYI